MDNSRDQGKEMILKHMRNLGTQNLSSESFRPKLISLGLENHQIDQFIILLTPAIEEYLMGKYFEVISIKELIALDVIANQREFNKDEKTQLYILAYEEKTGKRIEGEVDKYLEELIDSINPVLKRIKTLITEVDLSDEEKLKTEFYNLLNVLTQ